MVRTHRALLVSTAVIVCVLAAAAQTPPQTPPQTTFRRGIDVVGVDASVTDRQGNPVTDLTAADFEIKERGKIQKIDEFKFVQIDDADRTPDTLGEILSDADQERESAREDVRMIVIFLDDYHIGWDRAFATRDVLVSFVRRISPRDLVALVFPITPVSALTFSRDHVAQAQVIARVVGRKFDFDPKNWFDRSVQLLPPSGQEAARDRLAADTFKGVCSRLGAMREGPKAVVLVSEGIGERVPPYIHSPIDTAGPKNLVAAFVRPVSIRDVASAMGPVGDARAQRPSVAPTSEDRWHLAQVAAESNVRVFTFDTRGVESEGLDMQLTLPQQAARRTELGALHEELRNLSYLTGGRAMVNTTNYTPVLQQMFRDTGAYYLLGYTSTVMKHDGEFHEISTRVKRSGVDLRARQGYWALTEQEARRITAPAASGPPAEIARALSLLLPMPATATMRTWVATAKGADGETDVTVPDFTGPAPAISTPWVFRGRSARDLQQIKAAAAPLPAMEREFQRADQLLIRFHAYGPAGTTPAVTIRVLNGLGRPVVTMPPPSTMGDGAFELDLNFAPFANGDYVVDIDAAAGEDHARTLVALRIAGS